MDLAHVQELQGELQTAAQSVEEAIRLYTLKGNLTRLERAQGVLAELRGRSAE